MQKAVNFLRGSVRLSIAGAFPERFLNLCAQNGVAFWGVEWLDTGVLRLSVPRQDRGRAEKLAQRVLCTAEQAGTRGLPSFLARFRKRYALLLGLGLSLLAVCVLSRFVLVVEVAGNKWVTTAEIVTALQRQGLRPGVYGPGVDLRGTAHAVLLQLDELSFCTINLHGIRAEVIVRERTPKPALADKTEFGDVIAEAPGIITRMEVLEGEACYRVGDTVLPGEVLIAGYAKIPAPEYSQAEPLWRQMQAKGQIYARTWRTITAEIPLEAGVKTYTGVEKKHYSLLILGRRINFYGNAGISIAKYDKIRETWTATLPNGLALPLALTRETAREYEPGTAQVNRERAQSLVEERLYATLLQQVAPGQVVSTAYAARAGEGSLTVTLTAECQEEIGKFVPFATE